MRVEDAAKELGVSRSTMKRALKENEITWPSSRKRKRQSHSNPAGHGRVAEHLDGTNWLTSSDHVPSESNGVNDSTPDAVIKRTFVVKADYKRVTTRFKFSLSSNIEQLKEEVSQRLELEVGKFKMKYQDNEGEWVLMTCMSDLDDALHLSIKKSNVEHAPHLSNPGSNDTVVRLLIELKE